MNIEFWGATQTVTGSKYLLEVAGKRILIDCGLFQGLKELRLKNRAPLPISASLIDAVILTHAHLDHSGYIPLLIKQGFTGPVYCTEGTRDLCAILLPDSGHLQEEEARYANEKGFSKHKPALPLYTKKEAEDSLRALTTLQSNMSHEIFSDLHVQFFRAGHIIGSSLVHIKHHKKSILFSGDLGRASDPIMRPPQHVQHADYLVVESTYGNRNHINGGHTLEHEINSAIKQNGTVLIPTFAVGRAQLLIYLIYQLKKKNLIPDVPVFLDSPMARKATRIFFKHANEHILDDDDIDGMCNSVRAAETPEESMSLGQMAEPKIILSASGMATGGRVLHHLKVFGPDPKNTVLFAGYQAEGTRGAAMIAGSQSIKIHGTMVPIRAKVVGLNNLSAHADANEILQWLHRFQSSPRTTFITHGTISSAHALKERIEHELKWNCVVPQPLQRVDLG